MAVHLPKIQPGRGYRSTMPTISLSGDLTGLYFEITNAIDRGAKATTDETQTAMESGHLMRLLDRFHEIDIGLYGPEERDAINRLFQAHAADRSKRLGYTNNGLAYAAGVLVLIMLGAEWENPATGEPVDVNSLVLDM